MAAAILITGASRGLGFEFASQYSADGWRVFAACRSPAAATKLQRLAQDTGGILNVVAMDVIDAESVQNATTQLKDVAIDVLINSAGITGLPGQKTGNVDYESWAHVFNVNTMGPLRVLEFLSDHGFGHGVDWLRPALGVAAPGRNEAPLEQIERSLAGGSDGSRVVPGSGHRYSAAKCSRAGCPVRLARRPTGSEGDPTPE
jgi:NAD(P)-dependent dehydrogenase (short-subunit alcohol dehydrogenase family)